ncbi:unnamed protein product [Schistosoma mattheei]|uniref:Uncharacterized protein n=1 Tax=Schistosoma mattheei TaxID=31246 RepID=A0A183PEK0_9TREM|nr:unnamed protein product [Schistosoma mattheei]
MESSGPTEKRKTEEHNIPRNGGSHEKNEQELDSTGKKGPEQSGLENVGWRPMLAWWNLSLASPILAFTSASDPPCSSMMPTWFVKDSTSSRVSLSNVS